MSHLNPPSFVLVGAGSRGHGFSNWVRDHLAPGAIKAIAEPIAERRNRIAEDHMIPAERQFETWQQLLEHPQLADAMINATMDRDHVGSAVAAMRAGYHMMMEKPLATNLADAQLIDKTRQETQRIVSVCHSLRYLPVYEKISDIIQSGMIGDVVSLDQLEAVEHIHQSHSFVRGNWANEGRSTFMLLAKSCHDIDIIASLIPAKCERVSSFGSLSFFRPQHAPVGAPAYCVDGCPAEDICPYHSMKVYGPHSGWRHSAGTNGLSREESRILLRQSPYGKCVFQTDNDVVDHQVVAMEFAGGITATFTMTAFTPYGGRFLRIHGTKGYLESRTEDRAVDVWEFWRGNQKTRYELPEEVGGHGGGDDRVMANFVSAIQSEDATLVRTSTAESLRTHTIAFAAEQSRREQRQIEISELAVQ